MKENGGLVDAISVLEMSLASLKMQNSREMDFLSPRLLEIESRIDFLVSSLEGKSLGVTLKDLVCACLLHTSILSDATRVGKKPKETADGHLSKWGSSAAVFECLKACHAKRPNCYYCIGRSPHFPQRKYGPRPQGAMAHSLPAGEFRI